MPRINKTKFTILGLLSIKPMSGYDIKSAIRKNISYFWDESEGQIYPSLALLLKERTVTCQEKRTGKRLSKIYTITEKGFTKLRNWLQQEFSKPITRDEFLLKLFFGKNISPEESIKHVNSRKYSVQQKLTHTQSMTQKLQKERKTPPDFPYWMLILKYGQYKYEAELKWCDEVLASLKKNQRAKLK